MTKKITMKYCKIEYSYLFLICGLLFHLGIYAQSPKKEVLLSSNIEKLIYSNPEEAIFITQQLLSKPDINDAEKSKLIFQVAKSYKVKGDRGRSLHFLYQEKDFENYLSKKELFDIEIEKIDILINLSLLDEAKKKITLLEEKYGSTTSDNFEKYYQSSIILEKAKILQSEGNYSKAIAILNGSLKNAEKNDSELGIWYNIVLGELYLKEKNNPASERFFKTALAKTSKLKDENNYIKSYALIGLSSVYFQKKEYKESIKLLNEAYNYSTLLKNLLLEEIIINDLKSNYLATNDVQNYKQATSKLIEMFPEIYVLEQEAANSGFNLISDEKIENFNQLKSENYKIIYILLGAFLLILIYLGYVLFKIYKKKSKLESIIQYLKITRNNFINYIQEKDEKEEKSNKKSEKSIGSKKIIISKEKEQQLLLKLKKFENTKKFTNNDISLAVLAGQFETNTKYLSEVINTHYHINFNTYINRLRINYIVDMIKEDPNIVNYKISYLAEHCGFSSHSSFATIFKSLTGLTPAMFIDLVKNEKEILQENEN